MVTTNRAKHQTTANKSVQLPTSAVNVTLLAFANECRAAEYRPSNNQWISLVRLSLSTKPTTVVCSGRMTGEIDRQTDARPFTDRVPKTMWAVSKWMRTQSTVRDKKTTFIAVKRRLNLAKTAKMQDTQFRKRMLWPSAVRTVTENCL